MLGKKKFSFTANFLDKKVGKNETSAVGNQFMSFDHRYSNGVEKENLPKQTAWTRMTNVKGPDFSKIGDRIFSGGPKKPGKSISKRWYIKELHPDGYNQDPFKKDWNPPERQKELVAELFNEKETPTKISHEQFYHPHVNSQEHQEEIINDLYYPEDNPTVVDKPHPREFGKHALQKTGVSGAVTVTVHRPSETEKMSDFTSVNVSTDNKFCKDRYKEAKTHNDMIRDMESRGENLGNLKKKICEFCYARNYEELRKKTVKACYIRNGKVLTSGVLDPSELPTFAPGEVIRFDAFGELEKGKMGVYHFINYLNMALKNHQSYFVLWTKNDAAINATFNYDYRKPKNLTIIWSNEAIDDIQIIPNAKARKWADGVFNVVEDFPLYYHVRYGKDPETGVTIHNCNGRCIECKVCYSGKRGFAIVELKKTLKTSYNKWLVNVRSGKKDPNESRRKSNRLSRKGRFVLPYRPTSMRRR